MESDVIGTKAAMRAPYGWLRTMLGRIESVFCQSRCQRMILPSEAGAGESFSNRWIAI
jgi:hypothetical protein